MTLQVYNTLTRGKEPFETLEPERVRMYVCGPTVYDHAHVGHGMSSLVFDVIRRYLEYRGYQVDHVMNYTDVDDKVIVRARELDEDPFTLADRYTRAYEEHLEQLNVLPARAYPRVSQTIDQIIEMVEGLIARDYAYTLNGDVYFRVARDADYGRLSRRRLEDMRAGARLEVDERKEDPADFALWKAAKAGEPSWDSPWGKGRPGWHIECSAMSLHYLGEQIDIHGGGNDLVFPHHENEIAQTESLTDKPFARFWVHNGMLQFTGEKMSKSLGNVVTLEAFLNKHEGDVLRMVVLNSHYRRPLVYNDEVVQQAASALERLRGAMRPASSTGDGAGEQAEALSRARVAAQSGFEAAMDDDFNTPAALAQLFDLARAINQARDAGLGSGPLEEAQSTLRQLASVLGLTLDSSALRRQDIAPFVDLLVETRQQLRDIQQWELADRIRDQLAELGIELEDTRDGTLWRQRL